MLKKLKSEDYYLDKLTMFMRNSYGVKEHFSMMISILDIVDEVLDNILYFFDITKDEVFLKIEKMGNSSDILDKIGHLYGVKRNFSLAYVEEGVQQTQTVNLNNFEFWVLIKAQILQNCYDGSFEQMKAYYDKMHIPVYIFSSENSGSASIVLNTSLGITVGDEVKEFADNPNIEYLFKANLLTIRSMGIQYLTSVVDIFTIGVWDSTSASRTWDNAKWGL